MESVFVVTVWLSIFITESYLIFTDLLLLILEITKSSKSFDLTFYMNNCPDLKWCFFYYQQIEFDSIFYKQYYPKFQTLFPETPSFQLDFFDGVHLE